jgi:hypothetical protein
MAPFNERKHGKAVLDKALFAASGSNLTLRTRQIRDPPGNHEEPRGLFQLILTTSLLLICYYKATNISVRL